ncbi:MAG: 3-oxoacyl-(acyl-carrier-protein) reductase, partial [Gaiellaceae bacterium]|nr:3-oxoacyl-(acyl-carrier-protein) reductase [Gaiellaceae bacterium]
MEGLEGRSAIVTGGSTIIGRAVVRELHGRGAAVTIADIDPTGGEELAQELGERVLFTRTDITDDGRLEACVADAVGRFGGLDIVVNLAATYLDEGVASPRDDWLKALDVNVVSAVMLVRAARPHLVGRGGGAVVNFTSISSKVAQTGRWLYPVSKAALVQL